NSRRRQIFRGRSIWRNRDAGWRDLFQHRDDRLSGGADRSVVSRADCSHDVSADRKLRDQLARWGEPGAARARLCYLGIERSAEQLALGNVARGISKKI